MSDKITRTNQTRPCDLKIHRTCRDICKHINAVSNRVKLELYLRRDFYEAIFKIKHKLYTASRSAHSPIKHVGCPHPDNIQSVKIYMEINDNDHFQYVHL